jgi:hypothetical protein
VRARDVHNGAEFGLGGVAAVTTLT